MNVVLITIMAVSVITAMYQALYMFLRVETH